MKHPVIHRDPDILGGTPVFRETRVPIRALFDYFEAGDSIAGFLDDFPSVTRDQALELLELAKASVIPTRTPSTER